MPEQVKAAEGFVDVGGARLWYWDTGGNGTPIVLLHPASGSGQSWPYQQPFFAKAGYRVIGYSRRGHYRSDAGPAGNPGTGSGDLHRLVEALGLSKLHVIGAAAGGGVALDYAVSHPDRVLSLVLAGSLTGISAPDYTALIGRLRPAGFNALPAEFRELGPAYRAADPDGTARWLEIQKRAVGTNVSQPNANTITWATIEAFRVPTLLMWGDADLYTPPPVQRVLAGHFPRVETVVANECGHNPHWERSDVFNPAVLRFIRGRSR
ncbi:oxidoreductase [Lentzea sp. NBRC 105346]|nr:oxidoreductase [Lentzea sp. NBRC 105346]